MFMRAHLLWAHISISSIVVLTVLCHAWTFPPFPHIYAKLGSCQSVTLVTQSPTSPIRADSAGLGGGRAPTDLPTCQSRTGHPHACLLSDPISVCQTARQPSPREEGRKEGRGGKRGGGDLIRINYASPHRPVVLLIHERHERKCEERGSNRGRRAFKPTAGPSLEVFRVMFRLLWQSLFSLAISVVPSFGFLRCASYHLCANFLFYLWSSLTLLL